MTNEPQGTRRGHDVEHEPLTILQNEVDLLEDTLLKVAGLLQADSLYAEQAKQLVQQTLEQLKQQRQNEAAEQ